MAAGEQGLGIPIQSEPVRQDGGDIHAPCLDQFEVDLDRVASLSVVRLEPEGVRTDKRYFFEIQGGPFEPPGRGHTRDHDLRTPVANPHSDLQGFGTADRIVDGLHASVQHGLPVLGLEHLRTGEGRDRRDEVLERAPGNGLLCAELQGQLPLVIETVDGKDAYVRVQGPQDCDAQQPQRPAAVNQDRPVLLGREVQDRVQGHTVGVCQDSLLETNVLRDRDAHRFVGGHEFGEPTRCGARVACVDARREDALVEVVTPGEVALGTGRAQWLDSPGAAGEPGVQHDPVPHLASPHCRADLLDESDYLVSEDLREADERGHRVVDVPVHEDLFVVAPADSAVSGPDQDPVVGGQDGIGYSPISER